MAMTETKRNNTIKIGTTSQLIKRLEKWKRNRLKYSSRLDNELIDDTILKLKKLLKYIEQNGDKGWLNLK